MRDHLDGRVKAYDGERRSMSVNFAWRITTYIYLYLRHQRGAAEIDVQLLGRGVVDRKFDLGSASRR